MALHWLMEVESSNTILRSAESLFSGELRGSFLTLDLIPTCFRFDPLRRCMKGRDAGQLPREPNILGFRV